MERVATQATAPWGRMLQRIDVAATSAWAFTIAVVLYLACDGGGYSLAVHSQVGIAVWWIVVVGAACGLLPAARVSRTAWVGVGLFTAFVAWTAIATTWSISSQRSLQDLSLVACYLSVLVLAVAIHRDRAQAIRHTVGALATAIVLVTCLALSSRLWPHLFANADQTGQFLSSARARLAWPLNYWNALAALLAVGLPLLLAVATSARTLKVQAAAAAGIPLVALCGALTLSRGGVIAGTAAAVVFIALAPERIPKLTTALLTAAGSAVLIAGAFHRTALQQALTNSAERHDASSLVVATILVCLGVAIAQMGIGLAVRHGTPPKLLIVPVFRARALLAGGVLAFVAAGLVAGVPGEVDHVWRDFKNPTVRNLSQSSVSRFDAASGEGRYTYWNVGVHATRGHVLGGSGPGTFQLLWLPRAPYQSYVVNAHSLYVETFAELGVIGLALLVAFFVFILAVGVRVVARSRYEERTRAAGVVASMVAFMVFAAFDWIWQMPVLPAAFLILTAALLAPARVVAPAPTSRRSAMLGGLARVGATALGVASIAAIAFPLATTNAVSESQAAASTGNTTAALADAREAVSIEPGAASAQLQVALVLEAARDFPAAVGAARRAITDEPQNWSDWLTLSRLEAEAGHPGPSVAAYRQARALNPRSSLFPND